MFGERPSLKKRALGRPGICRNPVFPCAMVEGLYVISLGSCRYCGFLAAGPLLPPGRPLMLAGSCALTSGFCRSIVLLEPTVASLAGGPFLLPGAPCIPAPEFCALGGAAFGCTPCA